MGRLILSGSYKSYTTRISFLEVLEWRILN